MVAPRAVHGEARVPEPVGELRAQACGHRVEGDVRVVPGLRLGGGREERRVEPRALDQTRPASGSPARVPRLPVLGPGRAREIAAHHALERHRRRCGAPASRGPRPAARWSRERGNPRARSRRRRAVMKCEGTTPRQPLEPERADLGEHRALAGDRLAHHDVERAHPVAGDEQQVRRRRPRRPRAPCRGAAAGAAAGSRPASAVIRAPPRLPASAASGRARASSGREVLLEELADLPRGPAGVVGRLELGLQVGGRDCRRTRDRRRAAPAGRWARPGSRPRPRPGCAGG